MGPYLYWFVTALLAGGVLAFAYYCVVRSGYPAVPTYAWAIPVAAAIVVGLVGQSRITQIIGFVGLGAMLTLYYSETARRFWYVTLFRWRPRR